MPQEILHDYPHLPVEIPGGVTICVENDLSQMTTYILLEQEDWFEDEMSFVRTLIKPGMHIVDIGANHGVYALTFAQLLKDSGHVWAVEPAAEPGLMIETGIRLNGVENRLTLLPYALSDHEGEATLHLGGTSELNTLQREGASGGRTETIQLRTLDSLHRSIWKDRNIDFIKLDAEGEEVNVLRGGERFFAEQSPLIMFELKHGSQVNFHLLKAFRELGMDCYQLIPGLGALVPVDDPQQVDGYTLNLFACRPDRAAQLAQEGYLLPTAVGAAEGEQAVPDVVEILGKRKYATAFVDSWRDPQTPEYDGAHREYGQALGEILVFEDSRYSLQERMAAGLRAAQRLQELIGTAGVAVRPVLAYTRILTGLGQRSQANQVVTRHGSIFKNVRPESMAHPFVVPDGKQESLSVREDASRWLEARVQEFLERRRAFSSFFVKDLNLLGQLMKNPERSPETDRRVALKYLSLGKRVRIRPDSWLTGEQPGHRNALFWKEWATTGAVERKKRKLYLIAGMHRSGSTWLYNAVRLLLRESDSITGSVSGGWVGDWPKLRQSDHMVIKVHGYQAAWIQKADFTFYSYRDIRDAAASFRRKFGLPDPLLFARQSVRNDHSLRRVSHYAMRYERMVEDKAGVLADLAATLDIPLPSRATLQRIIEEIDEMSYESPGPKNGNYHLENLLHKGHITHGGQQSWEKDIPANLIEEMEVTYKDWFRENGYKVRETNG